MNDRVGEAVLWSRLIAKGDHVLVAVSGGADSMALLAAVSAQAPTLGATLTAAHFDHQLRPHSHRDAETVSSFCHERGIECVCGQGDVARRSAEAGESIEQAARHLRYAFLEETADHVGANRIATGHTRDDQVETVLMRVLRGSGIRGLSGIPARRGRIVRPILAVTRNDTETYCDANGIAFVDDPTNRDTRFTRNWIRHDVLPALRESGGDVEGGLLRLARSALEAVTSIRRRTDPVLDTALKRENDTWVLDTAALQPLDDTSRFVLFADLIAHRLPVESDAGRAHFQQLIALSQGDAHSGRMVSLPGLCARREHASLVFYPGRRHPAEREKPGPPMELKVPGTVRAGSDAIFTELLPRSSVSDDELSRAGQSGGTGEPHVAYFAFDALSLPLVWRSPQPGDRMRPFGMAGRRKLSDLFIDRRIEARHRLRTSVVTDGGEIVWLVGVATSESTRVGHQTAEVLRITVYRE